MVVDVRAKGSDFGTPRGGYPRSSHHAGAGAGKCWHIRRIISAELKRGEMVQVFSGPRLFGGATRVLQIWAADVPVFYVGDISERAHFCAGSLASLSLRAARRFSDFDVSVG